VGASRLRVKWTRPFCRKTKSGSARVPSHFNRSLAQEMKFPECFETSVSVYQSTRRSFSKGLNLRSKSVLYEGKPNLFSFK